MRVAAAASPYRNDNIINAAGYNGFTTEQSCVVINVRGRRACVCRSVVAGPPADTVLQDGGGDFAGFYDQVRRTKPARRAPCNCSKCFCVRCIVKTVLGPEPEEPLVVCHCNLIKSDRPVRRTAAAHSRNNTVTC